MNKMIFSLIMTIITTSLHAQDLNSSELKAALQKEVSILIIQASNVYQNSSITHEKKLQAAFNKVIPAWKCPSVFSEDLQQNMPLIYSCLTSVTAALIEGGKTNPPSIKYEGRSYKLTQTQLNNLQTDTQAALASIKNSAKEVELEYSNIGMGVTDLVKQLQQNYPNAITNPMLLTINLKRLVTYLYTSSHFDFMSNFDDERIWNAEKDSQAFMAKFFP